MPAPTAALTRAAPLTQQRRIDVSVTILVVIAGALLIAVLVMLSAVPGRVDLVVENPTAYNVHVSVRSAEGGGRLLLGTAAADSSKDFHLVLDRGEHWIFVFSNGGVEATPVEVSRQSVVTGAVIVPESVGEQFREAGLPPSSP